MLIITTCRHKLIIAINNNAINNFFMILLIS
uniref:Uncharacterized protein n=1 Tax=CrAss-like virus sp. ctUXy6 TaxID=2825835 RepID=A0A8S5V7G7_9CAUD|nr:MAG TPA: hypothetical protein [CrAss-like virus sp. ctUXy6]